jgi:hypothetical protein
MIPTMTRRLMLGGIAGAAMARPAQVLASAGPGALPGDDVENYVRLVGDTAGGWTYVYTRGQIYGRRAGEIVRPLMDYEAGLVNRYTKIADGNYRLKRLEVMQFLASGSQDPLAVWDNPWTGEQVTPIPGIVGPLHYDISLERGIRIIADYESGDDGEPFRPAWREIGSRFEYTVETMREYPNSFDNGEFGAASSGPRRQYCDFLTWLAKTGDMHNPDITNASATTFYSGQTMWIPWMFMGRQPGELLWHATGGKYTSIESLPDSYVRRAEAIAPGVLTNPDDFESTSDYAERLKRQVRERESSEKG